MRVKLICCEIFFREVCALLADSPNTCDEQFLPKGLHDLGADRMLPRLQEAVDAVDPARYEAILMGYALCNNGLAGLEARRLPLIVPKSHDCIGVFMGDRQSYREYFDAHPGTYYRTSGWTERNDASGAGEETVPQKLGLFLKYDELVAKYGEENAAYIMETMGDATAHYDRMTFIRMGLPCDDRFAAMAREDAARQGWTYEEIGGSLGVLRKLIDGPWDDDSLLTVRPGERIAASHDDGVIRAAAVACT